MGDKPDSLEIRAENGKLIGRDSTGKDWLIRWCGNGQHSHWTLSLTDDPDYSAHGWYVFACHYNSAKDPLVIQIKAAEAKFRIYT